MPKLRFPSGVPARRFRLFALAVLVYACTSEHSPTAPRGDESDPSFANAPAVTARPGGPYTAVEGSPISFDGTASSGTGLTYDWDFGDGTPHGTGATPTHVYVDNKKYNVRLVVTDASGRPSKAAQTTATIANAKPVVAALASPTPTPRANLSFSLSTTFTDAGTIDKHTGTFTWGDGGTSPATVTEANGSGSASASHTYTRAGNFSVSLRVVDNNGGDATVTLALVVAVNRLPNANVGGPYSGIEGSVIAFDGSRSADPDGDTFTYDWDFGDATPHGTGPTPSHTYVDNGSYIVKLVVTDSYGAKSTASQTTATVANATPAIASFTGPANGMTGVALTVNGSFTDVGTRDTHSATVDWGDSQTSNATVQESGGNGTVAASHTYAGSGSYTVLLRLADNGGATATATIAITVADPVYPPPTASAGGPYGGTEGQSLTFDGSASTSPAPGAPSYDWNFGDNSAHGTGVNPAHSYSDNGTYTVTLLVTDGAGTASQPSQTTATITNSAPVLGPLSGPTNPTPGTALTVSANFTDAGTLDTHSASFDWGDGTSSAGTITESSGAGSTSASHTYATAGLYTVALTLADNDGLGSTGTLTLNVQAGNNPPIAKAGGPYNSVEGTSFTFNSTGSTDPDGDAISYDWDFGDATAHSTLAGPRHAYGDNGVYTVTLIVTDSRGAASIPSQTTATISNAPPVITLTRGPTSDFGADHPFAVSATFTDNGARELHTSVIDWGDGSTTSPARLYDSTVVSSNRSWGTTGALHTYSAPGTYNVSITINDKDGGSAITTQTLNAMPPGSAQVLLVAGDIAKCGSSTGDRQTSLLLDQSAGWVQTLGDNAYPNGTDADFANCYDPIESWGKQKDRTHPAVGNHEYYGTPDASGYFNYFGAAAGNRGEGYYSYNLGAWHIVVANAEIPVALNTPENNWLRNDLATNTLACTAIVVHEPLFSSDPTGPSSRARPIWDAAYQYHVTLMLSGHAHVFERFAPQDPAGNADPVNGVRQFVVGTGGEGNISKLGTIMPNSEVQYFGTFGIMKLTLDVGSYSWQFIPTSGTFTDSGTGSCH